MNVNEATQENKNYMKFDTVTFIFLCERKKKIISLLARDDC